MSVSKFQENFDKLKLLANQLTAADVNLNLEKLKLVRHKGRSPPVTYINIYEDPHVTIGIFVLKPGEKLPLHDHPQMYGILKVIAGTARIQSYTVVKKSLPCTENILSLLEDRFANRLSAIKLPEETVNEKSNACFLTPDERNIHEIHSVNGFAAFLDILSPPYDSTDEGERTCHYYKEEKTNSAGESCTTILATIPSPPEYWNDTAMYEGPRISYLMMAVRLRSSNYVKKSY
ncbi:hypothetical protein L9F63_004122, partial [Diploptera punctata]